MSSSHAAYMREWRKKNPEKVRTINRRYYRTHGYGVRAVAGRLASQRYREKHREEGKVYSRQWRKAYPLKQKAQKVRYRGRRSMAVNTLTSEEIRTLFSVGQCFYCGAKDDLTLDHFIPLSRGGNTTRANILVACRSCNASKHDKMPTELLGQLPMFR